MFPGVVGQDKKNKRPYLRFWFAEWWKASSLFSPFKRRLFQLPILFSGEPRGRSDSPTANKKVHSGFCSENSQIKRIFLKAKQVGFLSFLLASGTNMYFVLPRNTEQADRRQPSSTFPVPTPGRTPILQRDTGVGNPRLITGAKGTGPREQRSNDMCRHEQKNVQGGSQCKAVLRNT